jgi:hypothetical protein
MDRQTAINALHRRRPLAAELPSTNPQHRVWVGVYLLDLAVETTRQFVRNAGVELFPTTGRAYYVRRFGVDCSRNDKDVWIGETDLINKSSAVVFSDGDLDEQLKIFGSSLESLQPHHKSDYPL